MNRNKDIYFLTFQVLEQQENPKFPKNYCHINSDTNQPVNTVFLRQL